MPKKKLVDVYRHVFALRHEVFTHRPIADSQGVLPPEDEERFRLQCNGVCTTLFMFMCILQSAIPEETGQHFLCLFHQLGKGPSYISGTFYTSP